MHWIDFILGVLLILTGLFLVILQVAVWLKWVTIPQGGMQLQNIGKWEILLVLAQKLPPLFIVGLILIYCGLKLIGIPLPLFE